MTTPNTTPPTPADHLGTDDPTLTSNEGAVATTDSTSDQPDDVEPGGSGREAAGYRRRLRAAEAERDGLGARVARLQRAEVMRVAAGRLAVAEDLFEIGGVSLADMLTETGDVDPAAVTAAIERMITERPRLGKDSDRKRVTSSALGGGNRQPPPAGPTWAGVIGRK